MVWDENFVGMKSGTFIPIRTKVYLTRSLDWAISQEEMRYEEAPVKALPPSRRRMMPVTPQQRSSTPIEKMQWQT